MSRQVRKKLKKRTPWSKQAYYDYHHVPPRRYWKPGDILLRIKRNRHVAYHILVGAPRNRTECAKRLLEVLTEFWPKEGGGDAE